MCSAPKNKEQQKMYQQGFAWEKENSGAKKEVKIVNKGLNLFGEYFDFGSKKAVIIISGRSEACEYSYFFAKPYKELGFNVLVIDNRAHGLSDGKYLTAGIKECSDLHCWTKFLCDNFVVEKVVYHGICIGAATALYLLTGENSPKCVSALVADGMFSTFYESFKNHIVAMKLLPFPVLQEVALFMKWFSNADIKNIGPIFCIQKLKTPILFLHSKEDVFSLPKTAQILYTKCQSKKQIVWFEKGCHSHIRINNQTKYDKAIKEFLKDL